MEGIIAKYYSECAIFEPTRWNYDKTVRNDKFSQCCVQVVHQMRPHKLLAIVQYAKGQNVLNTSYTFSHNYRTRSPNHGTPLAEDQETIIRDRFHALSHLFHAMAI